MCIKTKTNTSNKSFFRLSPFCGIQLCSNFIYTQYKCPLDAFVRKLALSVCGKINEHVYSLAILQKAYQALILIHIQGLIQGITVFQVYKFLRNYIGLLVTSKPKEMQFLVLISLEFYPLTTSFCCYVMTITESPYFSC